MKPKRLSQIIISRILTALAFSLAFLMIVRAVFVVLYVYRRAEDLIRQESNDLQADLEDTMEESLLDSVSGWTEAFAWFGSEEGRQSMARPDFDVYMLEYLQETVHFNTDFDEISMVDENGIIVYSSEKKFIGYDMHWGKQSSEFLCLLNGTPVFVQQFGAISADDTSQMRYAGEAFPEGKGFIQIGVSRDTYLMNRQKKIGDQIRYANIGGSGFFLLCDRDLRVISSRYGIHDGEQVVLRNDPEKLCINGSIVADTVFGESCYILVRKMDDCYQIGAYPISEAWEAWQISDVIFILIDFIVFAFLFLLIRALMKKHVIDGVASINGTLSRITKGDLEEKADFRDSLEFTELCDGLNVTVDRLKELIREAEERMEEEMELAARIQASFLPHEFPPFPDRGEFSLYASMTPAKQVGGDFYDYFFLDADHLALVIADVSGKGIPAALFMVMAKNRIRSRVMADGTAVAQAVAGVNRELMQENEARLFITVWLGILTVSTGELVYVDAGHEYPAILGADGRFRAKEDVHSGPVAARKRMEYEEGRLVLHPGDVLCLYTDGVTDANDRNGDMFGRKRLLEVLDRYADRPVEEIVAGVRRAIADYMQDTPRFDDTTMLCLRYHGTDEPVG